MIDRSLFQDTFSKLHASEESIQEVLSMTETTTRSKTRRLRRTALMTAAVLASLCVSAGVANAATGGALAQAVELHIEELLQVNRYKLSMETDGGNVLVYGAPVELTQKEGQVILTAGEETLDITETLKQDGSYTYEHTDGDTTLRVQVSPDQDYPGEWQYSITYLDPQIQEDNAAYSSHGSTATS